MAVYHDQEISAVDVEEVPAVFEGLKLVMGVLGWLGLSSAHVVHLSQYCLMSVRIVGQ